MYPLLRVGFCKAVFQAQFCASKCCSFREGYTTKRASPCYQFQLEKDQEGRDSPERVGGCVPFAFEDMPITGSHIERKQTIYKHVLTPLPDPPFIGTLGPFSSRTDGKAERGTTLLEWATRRYWLSSVDMAWRCDNESTHDELVPFFGSDELKETFKESLAVDRVLLEPLDGHGVPPEDDEIHPSSLLCFFEPHGLRKGSSNSATPQTRMVLNACWQMPVEQHISDDQSSPWSHHPTSLRKDTILVWSQVEDSVADHHVN